MPKKLVYFITLSLSGHLNPVCGLVHELAKNPDIECVIYGIEDHREKIERTGARFRAYLHRNGANLSPIGLEDYEKAGILYELYVNDMMNCAYIQVPAIVDDVRREKPDLIIYDPNFFPIKFLQEYLEKERFSVRFLEFYPNFVLSNELKSEIPELVRMSFKMYAMSFRIFLKQIQLSYHFGIPLHHPMNYFSGFERNTRLVAVFPELHPRLNDYDPKTHKFIGECISEETRNNETTNKDMELKSLLDQFPLNENKSTLDNSSSPKLIYVSLGTLFCVNTFIFELIIEAIRKIDPSRFRVVFSVGENSLKSLKKKIEDGELIVPETIMLRAFVPQLEVLKRADLFVTHSGMNSTSEAIRYAVPVICLPFEGDQPYNARRVCDELELGVRLDPRKLTADLIANTIDKVLGDEKYARNAKDMSEISSRYNGPRDGSKFIVDFLNQIEN